MKKYMVVLIFILTFLAIGSTTAATVDLGGDPMMGDIGNEGSQGIASVTTPVEKTTDIVATSNPQSAVNVTVNATDCLPGEKPIFTVKVTAPDGTPLKGVIVYLKLNGAPFYGIDAAGVPIPEKKTDSNGIAVFNGPEHTYYVWPSKQKPGVYPIEVTTSAITHDDVDYLNGSASGTANLLANASLKVITSPIKEGKNALVKVSLTANGSPLAGYAVLLQLGNKGYIIVTDNTGSGSVSIPNLKAGNTLIIASYQGNAAITKTSVRVYQQVLPLADLVITGIKKLNKNYYKITVKNIGSSASTSSKLKFGYGSKYKVFKVKSLDKNKSVNLKVKFYKYEAHKKYKKFAEINHDRVVEESFYNNNRVSFKNQDYQRYKADLIPIAVKKISKSKYTLVIANNGTAKSGAFKIAIWYKVKGKIKSYYTTTLKEKINPGTSIAITLSYEKTVPAKYYKYVSLNFDKKLIESNYKNNLLKFK